MPTIEVSKNMNELLEKMLKMRETVSPCHKWRGFKKTVSKLRIFSMQEMRKRTSFLHRNKVVALFLVQKFRPKGRGFTPSEIFCITKSENELSINNVVWKMFVEYTKKRGYWERKGNNLQLNLS